MLRQTERALITMDIQSLNLNLLKALDALLTEKNVSRAAERLHLSQPATSHSLNKLRDVFSDELLVRTAQGMELTPFAASIQGEVHAVLLRVKSLLNKRVDFDPETDDVTFHIGSIDYADYVILPRLFSWISSVSSPLKIHTLAVSPDDVIQRLEDGKIDLAITRLRSIPSFLEQVNIFEGRYACLVAENHPLAKSDKMDLSDYLNYPHISVSTVESLQPDIDAQLKLMGESRTVSLVVPHSAAIPRVLPSNNLIATLPESLAKSFTRVWRLKMLPFPIDDLDIKVNLIWHRRQAIYQPNIWLREKILSIAATFDADENNLWRK